MEDWSKKFNDLPKETRLIASAVSCQTNIQFLNFEKRRLKKRYSQSIKEINEHIKSIESWLKTELK